VGQGRRTALLGEAKWQPEPLGHRELEQLRRKAARVPQAVDAPIYALWGRAGASEEARRAGARGFDLAAHLDRCGQVRLRMLVSAGSPVEVAETDVTPSDEGAHAAGLGEG
jgi:hypothetical protein